MSLSERALAQDVWKTSIDHCTQAESIRLCYERARFLCRESGLELDDIRNLTPKFWNFHFDPIATRDMSAFIIATIHINLCIGTISRFGACRPDLAPLLEDLLEFNVCGEFMLTEIGHGLDARNIETTATLQPDGSFDLHSPNQAAWKAMPPTTPLCGMPRVSVVFARLIVHSKDHGIKPFIVWLSDSTKMREGITSRLLPTRPGTKPLDHSITSFNHVTLPPAALLGSMSKPGNLRLDFLQQIWRVSVGTLSLSLMGISSIKVASCIAAMYSQRRLTTASDGTKVPIIRFSTQRRPILEAVTSGIILEHFARWAINEFTNDTLKQNVQHALAVVFKAVVTRESQVIGVLVQQSGAQGLFEHNQMNCLRLTFEGNSIAEGDTLVLCIRLASELLGRKYSMPKPKNPTAMLYRHESGLFKEAESAMADVGGYETHRGRGFDKYILPKCRSLIEAIGNRMAYEAAEAAGCHWTVLSLYEKLCLSADLSWYTENASITRSEFFKSVDDAFENALPYLLYRLEEQKKTLKNCIYARFVTKESWDTFMQDLKSYSLNNKEKKAKL